MPELMRNSATATGTPPTGSPVTTGPSTTVTPTPTGTGLTLVMSAWISTDANNDGKAGVGDKVTFSFSVKNTGDVTLTGLSIADQLVAPAGPAVSVTCPASTLAPGATVVCTSSAYTVTQADVDAGADAQLRDCYRDSADGLTGHDRSLDDGDADSDRGGP